MNNVRNNLIKSCEKFLSLILSFSIVLGVILPLTVIKGSATSEKNVTIKNNGNYIIAEDVYSTILEIDGNNAFCIDPMKADPKTGAVYKSKEISYDYKKNGVATGQYMYRAVYYGYGGAGFEGVSFTFDKERKTKSGFSGKKYSSFKEFMIDRLEDCDVFNSSLTQDQLLYLITHRVISYLWHKGEKNGEVECAYGFYDSTHKNMSYESGLNAIKDIAYALSCIAKDDTAHPLYSTKADTVKNTVMTIYYASDSENKGTQNIIYGEFNDIVLVMNKSAVSDELNGGSLANAQYQVYSDKTCKVKSKDSDGKNIILSTDDNGYGTYGTGKGKYKKVYNTGKSVPAGTYYAKEKTAPDGYNTEKSYVGSSYNVSNTIYRFEYTGATDSLNRRIYTISENNNHKFGATVFEAFKIKLELEKSSAEEFSKEISLNNNSLYSLEGAEYSVYERMSNGDKKKIGRIVTDSKGYGLFEELSADKENDDEQTEEKTIDGILTIDSNNITEVYAVETKAPNGYKLCSDEHKFVFSGKTEDNVLVYTTACEEEPEYYTASKLIEKKSSETEKPLKNAVFLVEYYAGYFDKETIQGEQPLKRWYFATDENGVVSVDSEHIAKSEKYKSDDLYSNEKNYCLPKGTILFKEVYAPVGYVINREVKIVTLGKKGEATTDTKYELKPTTVLDTPEDGELEIIKTSSDGIVSGIHFKLESTDSKKPYSKDLVTNQYGYINVDNLKLSEDVEYKITELGIPSDNGYLRPYNTYVSKNDSDEEETYTATFRLSDIYGESGTEKSVLRFEFSNIAKTSLQIVKTADNNVVADVYFKVTNEITKESVVVSTDEYGNAYSENLPLYYIDKKTGKAKIVTYTIEELGFINPDYYENPGESELYYFPEYYAVPPKQTGVKLVDLVDSSYNDETEIVKQVEFHNTVKKGKIVVEKGVEDDFTSMVGLTFKLTGTDGTNKSVTIKQTDIKEVQAKGSFNAKKSAKVVFDNLEIFDDNGNVIEYQVNELGFLQDNGEYEMPNYFYTLEPYKVTFEKSTEKERTAEAIVKTLNFCNWLKEADLNIIKEAYDDIIEDVYFNLTASSGESYDGKTNSNGEMSFKNLPIYDSQGRVITYSLKELGFKNQLGEYEIPYRYISPSVKTFTLENQNGAESLEFKVYRNPLSRENGDIKNSVKKAVIVNDAKTGTLTVQKQGIYGGGLNGSQWQLFNNDDNSPVNVQLNADGTYSYYNSENDIYTVYFAVPKRSGAEVEKVCLEYISKNINKNVIRMASLDSTLIGAEYTTQYTKNADVYYAVLSLSQINDIDINGKLVYFNAEYSTGEIIKTSLDSKFSVTKAPRSSNGDYSSNAVSISQFDNRIFVIKDYSEAGYGKGYWNEYYDYTKYYTNDTATIYFAVPFSEVANWNEKVSLYYTDENVGASNKIELSDTGRTVSYDITEDMSSISSTQYCKVFSVTLTREQIDGIDNAKIVGFCSGSNTDIRTADTEAYTIMKAPQNSSDSYKADNKLSIADTDGMIFLISNSANGTEYNNYTGMWQKLVSINFAKPTDSTSDNVEFFYYNNESDKKLIHLSDTSKVIRPSDLSEIKVYNLLLTYEKAIEISESKCIGFCADNGEYTTGIGEDNSIVKAPFGVGVTEYGSAKSLDVLNNAIFVVSNTNGNTIKGSWIKSVAMLDTGDTCSVVVTDVPESSYYFIESKPPKGHIPYADKIVVNLLSDSYEELNPTIVVRDSVSWYMKTGGTGAWYLYKTGIVILLFLPLAVALYVIKRKRQNQAES